MSDKLGSHRAAHNTGHHTQDIVALKVRGKRSPLHTPSSSLLISNSYTKHNRIPVTSGFNSSAFSSDDTRIEFEIPGNMVHQPKQGLLELQVTPDQAPTGTEVVVARMSDMYDILNQVSIAPDGSTEQDRWYTRSIRMSAQSCDQAEFDYLAHLTGCCDSSYESSIYSNISITNDAGTITTGNGYGQLGRGERLPSVISADDDSPGDNFWTRLSPQDWPCNIQTTRHVPLHCCWYFSGNVFSPTLGQNPRIMTYLNGKKSIFYEHTNNGSNDASPAVDGSKDFPSTYKGNPGTVVTTPSNLTLNRIELLIRGVSFSGSAFSKMRNMYVNGFLFNCVTPQRTVVDRTFTLSGDEFNPSEVELTDIRLENVTGRIALMHIIILKNDHINNGTEDEEIPYYKHKDGVPIRFFTMKRDDGSAVDYERVPIKLLNLSHVENKGLYENTQIQPTHNMLPREILYAFCEDSCAAIRHGIDTGGLHFQGQNTVDIYLHGCNARGTTESSASYKVIFLSQRYTQIQQVGDSTTKGHFEIYYQ